VPPSPPAPAASVLTDLSNHPLLAATPALDLDVLNGIVETFQNQAKLWEKTLSGLATDLFVTLALIELVLQPGLFDQTRYSLIISGT
jgi:hypothetical protein